MRVTRKRGRFTGWVRYTPILDPAAQIELECAPIALKRAQTALTRAWTALAALRRRQALTLQALTFGGCCA
jgi:hypothetical protein